MPCAQGCALRRKPRKTAVRGHSAAHPQDLLTFALHRSGVLGPAGAQLKKPRPLAAPDSAQPCLQFGSRGAKQFVDEMVPALKSEFPHVDLVVEKRSGHPPVLEGFYRNGRRKPIGVKVRIYVGRV